MSTKSGSAQSRLDLLSRDHLETLVQLSQAFNSTIELDPLLHRILELMLSATASEAGALWVVEAGEVRCTHAAGPAADRLRGRVQAIGEGSVGAALSSRASVAVADALEDERYAPYRDAASGFRTRSAVSIPLVAGGEAMGVIELVNDVGGKDVFDASDIAFLEVLADDAGAAMRNARLIDAERRARNLKALLQVSHEITTSFDLERLLVSLVNLAGRAIRVERCAVAVWDREDLQLRAVSGEAKLNRKAADVRELEDVLRWAAGRAELVRVPDTGADDEISGALRRQFPGYLESSRARGVLILPLEDGDGALGQLLLEFAEPDMLDEWTCEAAELLANQAALSIRNAQLYADVPFISWLEPLAQKRRSLAALPGRTWMRYGAAVAVVLLLLFAVRIPVRVAAAEVEVRAALQRPARAGVEGTIAELLVREGDAVQRGQLVARLRNDDLQARLAAARGELRLAEREALASSARGNVSAGASARVRVEQARAALDVLLGETALLEVRAPATGIVLTARLEEHLGSYYDAGQPVLWVGAPDSAEVRLRIAQRDVSRVAPRHRVRMRVAARPDVRFEGFVAAIAPLAENVAGEPYYTVRATLPNPDGILRPGMTARARILTNPAPLVLTLVRRPWQFVRLHLWW